MLILRALVHFNCAELNRVTLYEYTSSWLIGKDPDARRDWGQEEKGTTEDDMAGWHHWLDGHESGWTLGVGDGQGGLVCCNSWGHKESDTSERLNWTDLSQEFFPQFIRNNIAREHPCMYLLMHTFEDLSQAQTWRWNCWFYGASIINFISRHQGSFQSTCTSLHSHQKCARVLVSASTCPESQEFLFLPVYWVRNVTSLWF